MRRSRWLGPLLVTSAALAAGSALAVWLWKRWGYAVHETQRAVRHVPEPPIETPTADREAREIQAEADGEGPRFHRTYGVIIEGATATPTQLLTEIQTDIQAFVPDELARFEKVRGDASSFAVGDEFDIHISSPWDGPVRVIDTDATSFAFGTLDGHMEAGQIRFCAEPHEGAQGGLRFTIESWARSRDALVDIAYDDVGLAKVAQQAMWTFFCQRVVEASGGELVGEVCVVTEREAEES